MIRGDDIIPLVTTTSRIGLTVVALITNLAIYNENTGNDAKSYVN